MQLVVDSWQPGEIDEPEDGAPIACGDGRVNEPIEDCQRQSGAPGPGGIVDPESVAGLRDLLAVRAG